MIGEAQVLEKEVIEFPSASGSMQVGETETVSFYEYAEKQADESAVGAAKAFAPRNERFARLKKHLRKRSVSIL